MTAPRGFASPLLDDADHRAARLVALGMLERTHSARARLDKPRDAEALHDFRVAVRRLRSWLDSHRSALGRSAPGRARRWLRRMAKATNATRDDEVFAGWLREERKTLAPRHRAAADWLLRRITRLRRLAATSLRSEVERDYDRAHDLLVKRLLRYAVPHELQRGSLAAPFAAEMASLVQSQAARLRRRMRAVPAAIAAEDAVATGDAIHRARIAGKRLRYLLEPVVSEDAAIPALLFQLETLQDLLGEYHDAHVWLTLLTEASPHAPRVAMRAGLRTIALHIEAFADARLVILQRDWLTEEPTLYAGLAALAASLGARGRVGVEIERKFLLDAMPSALPDGRVQEIDQGYLPGKRLIERVRRVREDGRTTRTRTVKSGAGIARLEAEEVCTAKVFAALWPLTAGRRVTKQRHLVVTDGVEWAIDEFTDRALVLAEVELPSTDTEVKVPAWLAPRVVREVTDEGEYTNAALAK